MFWLSDGCSIVYYLKRIQCPSKLAFLVDAFGRKWVLQRIKTELTREHFLSLCKRELAACTNIAAAYPKNYYAWTYRGMLVPYLSEVHPAFYRPSNSWIDSLLG